MTAYRAGDRLAVPNSTSAFPLEILADPDAYLGGSVVVYPVKVLQSVTGGGLVRYQTFSQSELDNSGYALADARGAGHYQRVGSDEASAQHYAADPGREYRKVKLIPVSGE